MKEILIQAPVKDSELVKIQAGDLVKINGTLYTLRDHTYKSLLSDLESKGKLPFDMKNQIIYYTGPIVSDGKVICCGPTTSARMVPYLEFTLKKGVKGIIGKGSLPDEALNLLKKYNAVYFIATGGAGAYLAKFIKKASIVDFKELGPEAIYKLEVENFPVIVAYAKGKYILQR